ncbi:MAG: site-specific integrase [Desulfovibrio sp.]|nr:site-specific integrase [Desulfovibrio sp.]
MAIRERKGRASPWQVYWNNPITGRRESTSFETRQEAEKHDSLIKHRLKFERDTFRPQEVEEQVQREMTLEAAYLLYLKEKQFSKKGLAWQLDAMRLPLKRIGTLAVSEITRGNLEQIREEMLAMPVKSATTRGRLSVLRTVVRWCAAKGFMAPFEFPKLPPAQYERFIPPTPEELSAIMAVAQDHIVRVIILGAQLGVRVGPSELLRLTWDDVDLESCVLRIHGAKKNPKAPWREVPIRQALVPLFKEWRNRDLRANIGHIIHYKGSPVQSIKTAWRATLRRAGIARKIRPYDLRHAFATELIAAGADIGTVAKLMGHSSPTMILNHYQYVMDSQKRAAIEALPEIGNVPNIMCPKPSQATARRFA